MKISTPIVKLAALAAIAGFAGFALGCAQTPVDAHWGESVRSARSTQTVDLDAGLRVRGPEGLDPVTGELVSETYKKNQRKEKTEPRKLFLITQ